MAMLVTMWSRLRALRRRRREDAPARGNRDRGTHCYYCQVTFATADRERTIDHRLPRSRKGSNRLINLVFACRACNERKADRPEADFVDSAWLHERRRWVDSVHGVQAGPLSGGGAHDDADSDGE